MTEGVIIQFNHGCRVDFIRALKLPIFAYLFLINARTSLGNENSAFSGPRSFWLKT